MRSPCEVCLENHVARPMKEYREVETHMGRVGMYVCGPHSSAITVSLERRAREAKAVPRDYRLHHDENGRVSAHEVQ